MYAKESVKIPLLTREHRKPAICLHAQNMQVKVSSLC
jgi:hypothetical protein